MIGRPGDEGGCAVDLFGQHRPRQGVGPSLGTKGEAPVSLGPHGVVKAISPANGEDHPADAVIPQTGQNLAQIAGGDGFAPLVARNQIGVVEASNQGLAFRRLGGFATLHLCNVHGPQAVWLPGGAGPRHPVGGKAGFQGWPQTPDADQGDAKAQLAPIPRWPESTDQIFSML